MKKRKLIFLGTALILLMCMLAFVSCAGDSKEYTNGPLKYCVLDDGTVKIIEYNGTYEEYTIPSKINGKAVTVIGRYAFLNDNKLKNLVISSSVKELEDQAVYACNKLQTIIIEQGKLECIDHSDIDLCGELTTLYIPSNVNFIGILIDCNSLKNIVIDEDNKYFCSVDGVIFSKDMATLVKYPQGKDNDRYTVPTAVKAIDANAFYQVKLREIYIPETVTTIAETAFAYSSTKIYTDAEKMPSNWQAALDGRTVYFNQTNTEDISVGAVKNLCATQTKATITLTWSKVKNAVGYRVYRKVDGKWKKLSDTAKNTYKVTSLKSGSEYCFAVKAYAKSGGKTVWAPKYTSIRTATEPAVTKAVAASQTTASVTLSWSKVTGATGYRIYKYNTKAKKYEKVKTTTALKYKAEGLKAGNAYIFKIRAYKKVDGKTIWGAYSSAFETATKCKTPSITKLSSSKGKVGFTWSNVAGESGYQVYYSTNKSKNYKKLASYKVNVTKGSKSKLKKGKTYYFKVRAYKKTGSGTVYSAYSTVKSVKVK